MTACIPEEWIKGYVDSLIKVAKSLDDNSVMQTAIALRAENILDMVVAFREKNNESNIP